MQTEQTPKRNDMFKKEMKRKSAKSSPRRKASRELTDKLRKYVENNEPNQQLIGNQNIIYEQSDSGRYKMMQGSKSTNVIMKFK